MKRFYLLTTLLTFLPIVTMAGEKVNVRQFGEQKPAYITPSLSTADLIVNENFEAFTGGTVDSPDTDNCLGDEFGQFADDEWIDPALTHGAQWRGDMVFAAGGTCFINNKDPQSPNYLKTPMGDYSGELKLTFLARAVRTQTASGVLAGSSLQVTLGSEKYSQVFDTDMPKENLRLYPNQGWCEVEITFNNRSAYNDACIEFTAAGGILIDDIRVTAGNNEFIASPAKLPVTDVKPDGFTINWQGVRKSFNYYVFLYTLKGYDEEGNPEYEHVFSPSHLEMIENSGMSMEEYLEFMPEEYLTYDPAGSTSLDDINKRSYTFSGLDPEKEYYYDVRSHYVTMFSEPAISHANVVSAPEVVPAQNIKEDAFTACWNRSPKATSYDVTLYGVQELTDDDAYYPLLDEDFEKVSEYTDADNIS